MLITLKEEYKFCTAESERSEQIKYAVDKGDFLSLSVYGDDSGKVLGWSSIERKHATTKWEDFTLNAYNPKAMIMRAHVPLPSQIYEHKNLDGSSLASIVLLLFEPAFSLSNIENIQTRSLLDC